MTCYTLEYSVYEQGTVVLPLYCAGLCVLPYPEPTPRVHPTSPCRELSTKLIIIIMFDSNCSQYRQISAVGPHIVLSSLQLLL